ncbi:MAG: hypothetical protein IVW51_16905 [Thermaceae bacterium]|nr:hypothetical protein [Thermaceae bacterium]
MRASDYSSWAESFIQTHRIVAVEINSETGEYKALAQGGSSYFLERLEQAQALRHILQEHHGLIVEDDPGVFTEP